MRERKLVFEEVRVHDSPAADSTLYHYVLEWKHVLRLQSSALQKEKLPSRCSAALKNLQNAWFPSSSSPLPAIVWLDI